MIVKPVYPRISVKLPNSIFVTRLFVGIVCFIITMIIVLNGAAPIKYDMKVDDISRVDIFAPRDVEDKLTTQRLREEAASNVNNQYDYDQSIIQQSQQNIYDFFSDTQTVRQLESMGMSEKLAKLKELSESHIILDDDMLSICLEISDAEFSKLQITVLNILSQIMDAGVEEGLIDKAVDDAKQLVEKVEMSKDLRSLSSYILSRVIRPNKILNEEETKKQIEDAMSSIPPKIYKEGEKIIGQGEKVKLEHYKVLEELGMIKESQKALDYRFIIGALLIVLLLYGIMIGYLFFFNRKILDDRSDLVLLGLVFTMALSFSSLLKLISFSNIYLIPLITSVMLITILLDTRLAIVIHFVISILVSMIVKGDTNFIFIALLSGTLAAFTVTNTYQRSTLVMSGIIISLSNAVLIIGFGLLGKNDLVEVFFNGLISILYSLLSIFMTIGVLPFLEASFNIVTPLKLLELSNPNQPLIKKLLLEAPGTYHHSLMVGNLAEAATEAIGGNALLARVAAYYHDIGKLKRPYFFRENQYDDNPHDRMTPNLSTLVITSHTKDGEIMAKNFKLPMVIRDIIKQHHGNTLVAYFFFKAKNAEKTGIVNEEDFRYEGPKPQTKEAAVVMLADCAEAAVRSMSERSKGKVEGMIRKIIKDKLDDGQFSNCDLTLKDLDNVAKAFLRVLSGVYHERIEYPEQKVKEVLKHQKQ